jgi:hypothetical protein
MRFYILQQVVRQKLIAYPIQMKSKIFPPAVTLIPCPFIDTYPASGVAGKSVIGEVVWRVRKYQIDTAIGQLAQGF